MSRQLKILHIAPFNTSGVPIAFVKAERELGHYSRLITLGKDRRNYEEDICLDLPFLDFWGTRIVKKFVSAPDKLSVDNQSERLKTIPKYWKPNGVLEKKLVDFRESLWKKRIESLFREIDFWNFDVYQFDGGLEFFRDVRTVKQLKSFGKKIICCYTGSDLRTRGVIQEMDEASDFNFTLEFDHLKLHPNIEHLFYPFDIDAYEIRLEPVTAPIKIGHAPTNRFAKGSAVIISAIMELQNESDVELVLIENLTHQESITRKRECHIFVDQIGDLGYGLNSLEALGMGIPTCSCLASGFEEKYSDHPFVVIDETNIKQKLKELIDNKNLRKNLGLKGRNWVEKNHNSKQTVSHIHQLADLPLQQTSSLPRHTPKFSML